MKKRILYIIPHRFNRSPGQRFRCEHFIPILEKEGYEITYSNLLSAKDDTYFYQRGRYLLKLFILIKSYIKRWRDVSRASQFDIVFVYREAIMLGTSRFEKACKKRGAKLVFDFDDSIWLEDTSGGNQNLAWLKKPEKTNDIIRMSDMTIVGNNYLAQHARQFSDKVTVIPTTIDTNYHTPNHISKETICIGWTGTETTLRHFLILENVLVKLAAKYNNLTFLHISNTKYISTKINLESVLWSVENEVKELQRIDIGIMPLHNDTWSKGKCGFKGLQYMSLEIPTVMSPVGVNAEIISHGQNGFLAETEEEWFEMLSELIEDKTLRKRIGKEGRKTIVESYSVDSQRESYLEIFQNLVGNA